MDESQALKGFDYASAPPEAPFDDGPGGARPALLSKGTTQLGRDHGESMEQVKGGMVELGVPPGLAEQLAKDDQRIGLRIYLLDNSGSMMAADGNILRETSPGNYESHSCTRWDEICAFAIDHAKWNHKVGTPAQFMILNSAYRGQASEEGKDFVRVDRSQGGEHPQVEALKNMLELNPPRGVTPITEKLGEITQLVRDEAPGLAQRGQMVFLTIATDGLPTSLMSGQSSPKDQTDMTQAMRRLCGELPVQLVVRLCTDDSCVVEFYNRIDDEMELPLDIIDDYESEAQEIASNGNSFFAYTPLLHRIREAGTLSKLLDSIDEQQLSQTEVRKFVEFLAPTPMTILPGMPNSAFVNEVKRMIPNSRPVYDPVKKRLVPFVDAGKLQVALKVGFRGRVVPVLCPCAN